MGGTELMAEGLASRLDLSSFQIVCSRVRELDESKYRIFWAHDLPGDPESEFLKNETKRKEFHHYVFVSNWQMWAYANHYGLDLSMCSVIPNAIEPIETHIKPDHNDKLRLIYYSTPHRGLELLVPVFEDLYSKHNNIHLDVYSSFGLYGWEERDKQYESLFQKCKDHPGISYHGSVPNSQIRSALKKSHILAYPSIWPETSCLVLIEAMSAGLACVHSNLAALPETSAGLTDQYTFQADKQSHMKIFSERLEKQIVSYNKQCTFSSDYVKMTHSWERVLPQWQFLLDSLRVKPLAIPKSGDYFVVRT
jgi:glycosyltransferase involved in cell wall biosynthesis